MTPRTMEEGLFEELRSQMQTSSALYDLRLEAPLFEMDHPRVLRAKMLFQSGESVTPDTFQHPEIKAAFYASSSEARRYHPEIQKQVKGTPTNLWQWLQKTEDVIVDFSPLGFAVLSKNSIQQGESQGLHRLTLPVWTNYATSPELWGTVGKWVRFHERLHTLFAKYDLLNGEDFPGFYPLKKEANFLAKAGFQGSETDQSFILNLNWTFPLTALVKLEEVLTKEH